jgi:hypothetical protein
MTTAQPGSLVVRRALDVADNWIGYTRLELAGFVIEGAALRAA